MLEPFGDPTDQRYEGEVDIVRAPASETVAPVNVLPTLVGDDLFELPKWCHWDVAVCSSDVRLVHDKLHLISILQTESPRCLFLV